MRILLIYPPIGKMASYNTPTGLLYVGTVLRAKGYDVKLVDCSVAPDYEQVLETEVRIADILGVYAMSVHIKHFLPLLGRLKEINTKMKIVWGGPHAILFPEQTARSPLADIVAKGEGENVMLQIVEGYESGEPDLHNIKGIAFEKDGEVFSNPHADFVDMETLPFLDWSLVRKETFNTIKNSIIRVQASRGCPYRCAFCINALTNNRKMRYRPAEKVLDEIEYLYNEHKITRVAFRDELFMSDRQQVRDIAQGLLDRNIKITWIANPRSEYLGESYVDDDYLQLLADSGCNRLQCGGESGSERILKMLHKGIGIEDILGFVRRTKKFDIIPTVAFMTGLPTETDEEQLQTLHLIRDILRIEPKAMINGPANFRPYPGGELYDMCIKEYDFKIPSSLEEWAEVEELGGHKPPWVKNLILNKYLWTSIRAANFTPEFIWKRTNHNPFKALVVILFSMISRVRLRYVFYKLPVEFYLLDWFYRFVLRKIPDFS